MLEVEDLWVRYGDRWVIRGVSLRLKRGDVILIVGDTGAGKSTLAKAIAGVVDLVGGEVRGSVRVDGVNMLEVSPRDRVRYVGILYQDPTIHFTYPRIGDDLEAYAQEVGVSIDLLLNMAGLDKWVLDRLVTELSMGQLQRLALAKVLAIGASFIIMDEPLAYLDGSASESLAATIARFSRESRGFLILEHKYGYFTGLVSRTYMLADGKLKPAVIEAGRVVDKRRIIPRMINEAEADGWVMFRDVWFSYGYGWVLRGLSFTSSRRIVVFLGPNGAGKTTVLRLIAGQLKPQRGVVKVERRGPVFYMPQDSNVVSSMAGTVSELYMELSKSADVKPELRRLEASLGRLGLNLDMSRDPLTLSEGERRLLMLALSNSLGAGLIILDEPTSGISREHRVMVAEYVNSSGSKFVIATQDLELVSMLKDPDVFYIRNGGVAERVSVDGV